MKFTCIKMDIFYWCSAIGRSSQLIIGMLFVHAEPTLPAKNRTHPGAFYNDYAFIYYIIHHNSFFLKNVQPHLDCIMAGNTGITFRRSNDDSLAGRRRPKILCQVNRDCQDISVNLHFGVFQENHSFNIMAYHKYPRGRNR